MKNNLLCLWIVTLLATDAICSPLGTRGTAISGNTCPLPRIAHLGSGYPDGEETLTNNGTDVHTEWDLASSKLRLRASSDDGGSTDRSISVDDPVATWNAAVPKGRALWQRLQDTLNDANARDAEICGIDQRWAASPSAPSARILSDLAHSTLPSSAIPLRQDVPTFYSITMRPKYQETYRYKNAYSPQYGVIAVYDIVGLTYLDVTNAVRAPDRWSDVTWATWRSICTDAEYDPGKLQWIVQDHITNMDTEDVIDQAIARFHSLDFADADVVRDSFEPGDEAFFALLSTPNAVGTVYMLMQNVVALGRRNVKEIGIYRIASEARYNLYVELDSPASSSQQHSVQTA